MLAFSSALLSFSRRSASFFPVDRASKRISGRRRHKRQEKTLTSGGKAYFNVKFTVQDEYTMGHMKKLVGLYVGLTIIIIGPKAVATPAHAGKTKAM
jgi:hypothetical protein